MLDNIIGLLLLGLGVNKTFYVPNPDVKGDETVASQEASIEANEPELEDSTESETEIRPPKIRNTFRLDPQKFQLREEVRSKDRVASRAGVAKRVFDVRAFGKSVLKMQEDFAQSVEASREAAKQEMEIRREALKQQFELIKNTRKKALVEKLSENCENINEKRTEKMTAMLEKLSTILTNVTNRAATAETSGKDITSVSTAVTTAQTAIGDAQAAVAAQAGASCDITITSETNLKTDVGQAVSGLQQDLKSVYAKVIAARQSVGLAVKALAVVLGESLTPTPSPTP